MKIYIHYIQIFNSFLKFIKARFTSFISNLFFFFDDSLGKTLG